MAVRYYEGTVRGKGPDLDTESAARQLRKAMKGIGTNEKAIIELLSSHNNYELQEIKNMYKTMYGRVLGNDLIDELSGHFLTLCLYLLLPRRMYEAYCLHRAIAGLGTDERTLIEMLCTATNYQIQDMKAAYREKYKADLEKDVRGDSSGHFRMVLVSLLQGNRSEEQVREPDLIQKDAKDLYKAGVKKVGTDESVFNRILVTRSVPHLQGVFQEYVKLDDQDIRAAIRAETSGDLRDAYLAIARYIIDPLDYFAECFYKCMAGPGTDDERLMQLVVTRCELDLKDIADAYLKKYGVELVTAIKDDTSGDYRKLLLRLTTPTAPPVPTFDPTAPDIGQCQGQTVPSK